MKLCDDKHDEVCYDSRHCPVCEKIEEIEQLEKTINDLEEKITETEAK